MFPHYVDFVERMRRELFLGLTLLIYIKGLDKTHFSTAKERQYNQHRYQKLPQQSLNQQQDSQ
jgi:hypothetical protein